MRSTNSKPQPTKQFPKDQIKLRPTFYLVLEAVSQGYTSQQGLVVTSSCTYFCKFSGNLADLDLERNQGLQLQQLPARTNSGFIQLE